MGSIPAPLVFLCRNRGIADTTGTCVRGGKATGGHKEAGPLHAKERTSAESMLTDTLILDF